MTPIAEQDWEQLGIAFRSAEPFPSICIDGFLEPEFADEVAASYPDYKTAQDIGREFANLNEKRKIQITEPRDFPNPVSRLADAISSKEFMKRLEAMTGINNLVWDPDFSGGGMHLTASTGILDVHVDFNYEEKLSLYRRLNILIYLNPEWKPEWGGAVELWDREVKNCIHSFEPIHNRCVIFETSDYSYHGVTAVQTPGAISRNSFAVYYYTEDSGENDGRFHGGKHSTIFRARPDEQMKKFWSMPLNSVQQAAREQNRRLRKAIKKMIGRET
jgi:hypothetical protein